MQDLFLQVFVVALGLLMYPNSDHNVDDWDEALLTTGMQHREQKLSEEEKKLNQEIAASGFQKLQEERETAEPLFLETLENSDLPLTMKTSSQVDTETWPYQDNSKIVPSIESTEKQTHSKETPLETALDHDYIWIMWKTFSVVSFIHFVWKCRRNSHLKSNGAKTILRANAAEYLSVDSTTLQIFYSQRVQSGSNEKHREEEFLDGFVGDLLESMKNVCGEVGGMEIGTADFKDVHNVVVSLTPPESYTFNCFYCNKADDVLLDMQMCGQIELRKNAQIQYCCPCQASGAADVVCLLHNERDKIKQSVDFEEHLCKKGSKYLSKAEVGKWFQNTLRQAWSLIAFKYEFEVCIDNRYNPGAVTVRFRSGEKMHFTMSPVIRFDSHLYFFITRSPKILDTSWSLSLSEHEDTFLHQISKVLPDNSCHMQTLQIALFLHKKQAMLTGSSALKDLHFKIGLMHLLLNKAPCEWKPSFLANRLRDLLNFMMYSLKTKQLIHVLIGNPRAKEIIQLPADLVKSNPVNLFHPLVVHRCIYQNAVVHFVELQKNAQIWINDYLGKRSRPNEPSK